jgi:DNA-binding MarR family transcriptional regulator
MKTPSDSSDIDALENMHTIMHAYRALQYRFLRDGPHSITHMDGKVLGFFGQHPGSTQRDLAERSGRDKAQLARLVKGLRDQGLLRVEPDEADRRNVKLFLTDEGQAIRQELKQQSSRLSAKAVAGFSRVEREQLLGLLQRVRENLGGR